MHYQAEVVLPPTNLISKRLETILGPYQEEREYNDESTAFWDWFVIGGRFSGKKIVDTLSAAKIRKFYEVIRERKITFCGLVCGKHEVEPESQIPEVDALWNEMFPDTFVHCPLFQHSGTSLNGDIQLLGEVNGDISMSRFIVSGCKSESISFMLSDSFYNGVNHENTVWSAGGCTFSNAMELLNEYLELHDKEWAAKARPKDDWLVVTVDYHS